MTLLGAFAAGAAVGAAAAAFAARRAEARRFARWGRLFSFAMHELNTPVTAVNMTVMNMIGGVFGPIPPELRKWVEMTRDQMSRMSGLVGEIRDLVHLELHRDLRAVPAPEPAAQLLEDALRAPRGGFVHAGIPLDVDVAKPLPAVRADADRAARSLASLLSHARKFRASGPVTVRARREGPMVAFEVEYQGRPLAPGEGASSLELYYPAEPRRDEVLCATGLGLGFVRHLSRRLGGDLEFDVEDRGRARLRLLLPVAQEEA